MASKPKISWRWGVGHVSIMKFYVEYFALPVAHMYMTMGQYNYELYMNVKGRTGQSCIHLNTEEEAIAWLQEELKGIILPTAPRRICWREVNLFEQENNHEDMLRLQSQFT